jgi:phosphomannomutase
MTLMVGVSGVRGIVGESLTPALVLEFAQAYGTLLEGGRVVAGQDSRPSGQMYAAAALAGLLAAGCTVTDVGIAMTPTIAKAIRDGGYAGGICITASHNPAEWNGLKFLDENGLAPDAARAAEIASIRSRGAYRAVKSGFASPAVDAEAGKRHVEAVRGLIETDLRPLRGMQVVLDSINGAGCVESPALLRAMGCTVIHLNGEPTGQFAHRPEPVRENLAQLCEVVRAQKAAIGFAQDPDADRLAIVDERGEYIGEEYTLALATWSVLSRRPGPAAANLSTSRMIDDVARRFGMPVIRTPVGEAHVARAMLARGCVVGGEGNGGVIDPRVSLVRDSLSAMSLVLQLIAATGKTASQLVAELPRYASIKEKFECDRARIARAVQAVAQAFETQNPDRSDGVRIDFPEGWVHLRASNTEPIVRIIGEAVDEAEAVELVRRVRCASGL